MGAAASVSADDDAGAIAEKLRAISPAYAVYAERVLSAGLSGAVIKSLAPEEMNDVLMELGVTSTLHAKVLMHSLECEAGAAVASASTATPSGIMTSRGGGEHKAAITNNEETGAAADGDGGGRRGLVPRVDSSSVVKTATDGAAGALRVVGAAAVEASGAVASAAESAAGFVADTAPGGIIGAAGVAGVGGALAVAGTFNGDACLGAIKALTDCAGALPVVAGIGMMAQSVVDGIRVAKVNKMAVQSMGLRVQDVSLTLAELMPLAMATTTTKGDNAAGGGPGGGGGGGGGSDAAAVLSASASSSSSSSSSPSSAAAAAAGAGAAPSAALSAAAAAPPTTTSTSMMIVASPAMEAHLLRVAELLRSADDFVREYGRRGFLSRMFRSNWDDVRVRRLDSDFVATMEGLAAQLGVAQLKMQKRTFDEIAALSRAIADSSSSSSNGSSSNGSSSNGSNSSNVVGAVARAAGISEEEAAQELQALSNEIRALGQGQEVLKGGQQEILELLKHMNEKHRRESMASSSSSSSSSSSVSSGVGGGRGGGDGECQHGDAARAAAGAPPSSSLRKKRTGTWECQVERGRWEAYDAAIQKRLNRESVAGKSFCSGIRIRGDVYTIDFTTLAQVNEESGRQRRVRCNECADDDQDSAEGGNDGWQQQQEEEDDDRRRRAEAVPPPPLSRNNNNEEGGSLARSVAVDTNGDGEADSYFDATRGILCMALPEDTTGDGVSDRLAVDMSGDGLTDTLKDLEQPISLAQLVSSDFDSFGADAAGDAIGGSSNGRQREVEQQAPSGEYAIIMVKIKVPPEYRPGMQLRFAHPRKEGVLLQCTLPPNALPGETVDVKLQVE